MIDGRGALPAGEPEISIDGLARPEPDRGTSLRLVGAYFVVAFCLLLVVAAATGPGDALPGSEDLGWIQGWARWDSGWYRDIANDGYFYTPGRQSSVAFFPTYPILLTVGGLLVPVLLAGYVVTLLSGLACCLMFHRWCADRMPRVAVLSAVAVLFLFPYSFYLYGAVYADALFLACCLGAFLLLERGRPVLAGLVGIAATAGRPVGIALVVGLAVRAVELAVQRRPMAASGTSSAGELRPPSARPAAVAGALRHVTWRDSACLLSVGGIAAYCAYLGLRFGDPLAFVAAESAPKWQDGSGYRVWLKFAFFERWQEPLEFVGLAVPALISVGVVLLLPTVRRRFGWGYAAYTAIIVAIPLIGTKDFIGLGRYLVVAFPAAAALGQLLSRPPWARLRVGYLVSSAAGLVLGAALYGAGYLIS